MEEVSFVALRRTAVGEFLRRHPLIAIVLVALITLVALSLLWHLVAMEHGYPSGMLGGCIAVPQAAYPGSFERVFVPYAQALEQGGFFGLEAAHADQAAPPRVERRVLVEGEARIAVAEQTGDRHTVQLSARGRFRGMGVHVGVDPDQPQWPKRCERPSDPLPGADGAGVIAPQDHGKPAARNELADAALDLRGHGADRVGGFCPAWRPERRAPGRLQP